MRKCNQFVGCATLLFNNRAHIFVTNGDLFDTVFFSFYYMKIGYRLVMAQHSVEVRWAEDLVLPWYHIWIYVIYKTKTKLEGFRWVTWLINFKFSFLGGFRWTYNTIFLACHFFLFLFLQIFSLEFQFLVRCVIHYNAIQLKLLN